MDNPSSWPTHTMVSAKIGHIELRPIAVRRDKQLAAEVRISQPAISPNEKICDGRLARLVVIGLRPLSARTAPLV